MLRKKWITVTVVSVSIILLIGFIYGIFTLVDSLRFTRENGGIVLEDKKYMTFDCNANYKYIFFNLDIDTSNCKGIIRYDIKDSSGKIVDSGDITSSDKMLRVDKSFVGHKGTWYIEFQNVADGEIVGVTYTIEARNTIESRIKR